MTAKKTIIIKQRIEIDDTRYKRVINRFSIKTWLYSIDDIMFFYKKKRKKPNA